MPQTFTKDPSAVSDFSVDWSVWLNGDTISTSTWTLPSGITKDSDTNTTTTTTIWLSGGTAGTNYTLTNTIVTANARTDERTIVVSVANTRIVYSSIGEVVAYTRHLLDGQTTFNSTTRPTHYEVSKFIERACAQLNVALSGAGLTTPITQYDARLACDDWVTWQAARYVEMTQRGVGYNSEEGTRSPGFGNLAGKASEWVKENLLGFKNLGVGVSYKASDGLQFTGMDAISERSDPDDSTLRQPIFRRGLYDEPQGSGPMDEDNEDEQ